MLKFLMISSLVVLSQVGCKSNPHKAEEAKTALENQQSVGGGIEMGRNDKGEVITQRKEKLADQLKELQSGVYNLESEIYGHEKYGRQGLYGVLKDCMDKKGELKRLPSKAILTRQEDKFVGKMVLDEKKDLVNVSEEYFLDRIKRFEGYQDGYEKQKEDFEEKVRICQNTKKAE
jgi:hypothetical protein